MYYCILSSVFSLLKGGYSYMGLFPLDNLFRKDPPSRGKISGKFGVTITDNNGAPIHTPVKAEKNNIGATISTEVEEFSILESEDPVDLISTVSKLTGRRKLNKEKLFDLYNKSFGSTESDTFKKAVAEYIKPRSILNSERREKFFRKNYDNLRLEEYKSSTLYEIVEDIMDGDYKKDTPKNCYFYGGLLDFILSYENIKKRLFSDANNLYKFVENLKRCQSNLYK